MTIEIWADIVCPFCYIGKRQFEKALLEFEYKNKVSIIYHSFELYPDAPKEIHKNAHEFLAERKGVSVEKAKELNDEVAEYAKRVGLEYNFDRVVPINSFNAHRLMHLAKKYELMNEMVEWLYRAHFTEGIDLGNHENLIKLGKEVGLDEEETRKVLDTNTFRAEVLADQAEAVGFGISGVPCFIFERKLAVIGAHPYKHFLSALQKAEEISILK